MLRTLALIALAPALAFAKTTVARDARAGDLPVDEAEATTRIVLGEARSGGQNDNQNTPHDIHIDRLRVVPADSDGTVQVRLVLVLSSSSVDRRQAVLPIALPAGAHVVGARVSIGNEPELVAIALAPAAAREEFTRVFQVAKDPLLVERMPESDAPVPAGADPAIDPFATVASRATTDAGYTHYVVRAFPLSKGSSARVELDVELAQADAPRRLVIAHAQPIASVEVVSGPADARIVRTRRDVRAAIAMPLPAPRALPASVAEVASRTGVDAERSLYAGWATRTPTVLPTITIGDAGLRAPYGLDKATIRRTVKQHLAQLARCYTKVTEYQGGPEGTAVLRFFIAPNGLVAMANVDGEIDDERITSCLASEVRQWEFPRGDGGVLVNYPLTFKLAP